MIRITSFAKAKENTNGNNTNGYANSTTTHVTVNKTGVEGVNIWGQYHDHTADISGDMSGVRNISANGNIVTSGDIQGKNITATNHIQSQSISTNTLNTTGEVSIGGELTVEGDITNNGDLHTNNIFATNGTFTGDLSTLNFLATNGEITNLTSKTATIDNLTVTKAAHFYKLIIDEIKATQGQIIVTPANAEIVDIVYNSADGGLYKLFFLANDETTGKEISNTFDIHDQILCQTFNAATGTSYDVSNKFYWSKCIAVSSTPVERIINGTQKMCHYIIIDWSDKDPNTNGVPEVGDEIVMLGNRTDTLRQNAITIGAYNNPYLDNTIKAPFIIQYAGINDYDLSTHRKNVISNGYNLFNGTFTTTTGDNIEDLINQMGEGTLTYMHTAYANNATGNLNFSKSYFDNALYMGFCSNHTQSDTALIYSDYTWVRIKGNDGQDGEDGETMTEYKLIPITEQAPIDKEGTVGLLLKYNILHINGQTYETVNATSNLSVYYKAFYENNTNTYTQLSINTKTPTYSNASYQTNYNDPTTNKLLYVEVILSNSNPDLNAIGNVIYDRRLVYPAMLASATFEITDEIKSTVQGHEELIDGMTNSISTIEQKYNQIQSTVSSHTTQINNLGDDIDALDGRVTTNTTNISQITQRADSIEATVTNHTTSINQNTTDIANLKITADEIKSTVSSYNASIQNLFNFTYCKWENVVPFIQGYGIEATGNLARISNLGFDGEGGDFVVSCQMRMQNSTSNIYVNMCDKEAEDNASTQEVTTSWKSYTFRFKSIQQYIGGTSETTTSYNGFIDFEGATNSNRLYVRHLMINRGNVAIAWGVSSKDLEAYKDEENIVPEWTLEQIEEEREVYKGYKCYTATASPLAGRYIDYMYKANLTLEQNTPYTLTFYARNAGSMIIASYLSGCVDGTYSTTYTNLEEGESTEMNSSDGVTYSRIGNEIKKYTIHWYNQNAGTRTCIVARANGDWATDNLSELIDIYGAELRKGYWTEEQSNSNSLINQTANNIQLNVYDELKNKTGIDITNGKITLDADNTTIVGNLNITDTNNGITVYDNDGVPRINIQPKKISEITEDIQDAIIPYSYSYTNTNASSWTVNSETYGLTLTKGDTLDIKQITTTMYAQQGTSSTSVYPYNGSSGGFVYGTLTVKKPNKVTDTYSLVLQGKGYGQFAHTSKVTLNADMDGTYNFVFNLYADTSYISSYNRLYADISCLYELVQVRQTYIGTDGMFAHTGASKQVIFDEDKTLLQFGGNGIRWTERTVNGVAITGNKAMDVAAKYSSTNPTNIVWLPFYNYVPIFNPGNWTNGTIINTGHTRKYYYTIDVQRDRGICVLNDAPLDTSGNVQDAWILLPNQVIEDGNGNIGYYLPVGYQLTIINHTFLSGHICNLFVSGDATQKNAVVIVDSNRNTNYYCNLSGSKSSDTYIYMGTYINSSTGINTMYWQSLHDTQ